MRIIINRAELLVVLKLALLIQAMFVVNTLAAQHEWRNTDTLMSVSGLVYSAVGEPIPSVTVSLYSKDSQIISNYLTDTLGAFRFTGLSYAKSYLITFHHISFKDTVFMLTQDSLTGYFAPLVTILRQATPKNLERVTVVGKANLGLQRIPEGFSFGIDKRLKKFTVWEILKQTPLINAQDDGTLNILGKQGVNVYINGRKSNILGSDLYEMLKNMSSENLRDVQILTIPSSKYEAQGSGGIINLILDHLPTEGLLGSISFSNEFAYYDTRRANINLNYSKGRITTQLSIRGGIDKNKITEQSKILLNTINLQNNSLLSRIENKYPLGAVLVNDIQFSNRHRLNVQTNLSKSTSRLNWITTNRFETLGNYYLDSTVVSGTIQEIVNNIFTIDVSDNIKLDSLGSYMAAGTSFFKQDGTNNAPYTVFSPNNISYFKTSSNQHLQNYAFQLDFHKVFRPRLSADAGIKFNWSKSNTDNSFANLLETGYVPDISKENSYIYKEGIYGLYSSIRWEVSQKVSYVFGFRLEQTSIDGNERISAKKLRQNYLNLFPDFNLSWSFSSLSQLNLNLNSRINRPAFWELNPTPVFSAPTIYYKGNAFLLPSKSFNTEISYLFKRKITFLFNYTRLNNDWMQFQITRPRSDTVVYDRFNYGKNTLYSFSSNYSNRFFKSRMGVNTNIAVNNNDFIGSIPSKTINNNSWQMLYRFRSDFDLDPDSKKNLYLAYNYYSPLTSAQGHDLSRQTFEVGGSIKINNVSLQISWRDIFNSGVYRFENENRSVSFTSTKIDNSIKRAVITISYNFGNKNTRKTGGQSAANEEQKGRVQQ